MDESLLSIKDLQIGFPTKKGMAYAVDGLCFSIERGQSYALLGESGCGKSLTALSILKLLPPAARLSENTQIRFKQNDITRQSEVAMRSIRGRRIAMIFQEPMTSLNPVLTIGDQIGEVIRSHFNYSSRSIKTRVMDLLNAVAIPNVKRIIKEYPHQLSGGMKQRAMIAMALAGEPDLLIADEPTTALDVTIQAQVLDLIKQLQKETQMALLLITHDLGVVSQMADKVGVMYAGHLLEESSIQDLLKNPLHPYSQKLFESLPNFGKRDYELQVIKGSVPPLGADLPACRFADRCPYVWSTCREIKPKYFAVQKHHYARCHLNDEQYAKTRPEKLTEKSESKPSLPSYQGPEETLLSVKNLKIHFPIRKGIFKRTVGFVKAVDGVSFDLYAGKTLALVGESGSGKTTTGRGILQLIPSMEGSVTYQQYQLSTLSAKRMRNFRRDLQIIFQDPYSSMNPRMMVGDIIAEGMVAQGVIKDSSKRRERVEQLLNEVGLPIESQSRYPHEFSGGQRQRICIARALALDPKIIICDEPTSALDVSVQAQILNLLKKLQSKHGLAYLFITHDISVVAYLAYEVAVMTGGKIVEQGLTETILKKPKHAYTKQLLESVPTIEIST